MRALKSSQLSHMQKTSVLTFLECRNCPRDIDSLRSTTIRLFGMYSGIKEPTSKTFVADAGELNGEGSPDELLSLRKSPKKKARPGTEAKSIRKTQADMNMDNAMVVQRVKPGTLICYRCGKKDHLLKNCPLPYQPTLAFAPNKDSMAKNTLLADEESNLPGEMGGATVLNDPAHISESKLEPTIPTDLINVPNTPPTDEEEAHGDWIEDLRLASWVIPTTESILVCESNISKIFQTLDTTTETTQSDSMKNSLPIIIIDSGASSTVWIVMG